MGSISFQCKKATSKMSCAGNVFLAYGRKENNEHFARSFLLCNEHLCKRSYHYHITLTYFLCFEYRQSSNIHVHDMQYIFMFVI